MPTSERQLDLDAIRRCNWPLADCTAPSRYLIDWTSVPWAETAGITAATHVCPRHLRLLEVLAERFQGADFDVTRRVGYLSATTPA